MYKKSFFKGLLALMCLSFMTTGCNKNDVAVYEEIVAVTNRGGASVSLFNATNNQLINTIPISGSEPMYVVYVPVKDKLYVGDRAGKKVHIINPTTKAIESSITVGNGVFHMWADGNGKELWVNNDVDNTISVINLTTNTVSKTINVGIKPHDVFLTKDGTKAYVSVLNSDPNIQDKVYVYSVSNYTKIGEVNVGKDPHLYHLSNSNKLYVPCQSGQVYTLNGNDLSVISNKSFVGAHGIFPSPDQSNLFVTNISGNQIYSINASTSDINGAAINTPSTTPHNVVLNETGNKIFITHSGATSTAVTTYTVNSATLTAASTITAGLNPFGLTYYKRKSN